MTQFTFIDLFCGIGGFHIAAMQNGGKCVFACDNDKDARKVYQANFNIIPKDDITQINVHEIPCHDLLCAGFPCQPFSIIGNRQGFEDQRGLLFFDVMRIINIKRPHVFILENVKQLATHHQKKTFSLMLETMQSMPYTIYWNILNALDYGIPQKRERLIMIGFRQKRDFTFPSKESFYKPLSEILEEKVDQSHYASHKIAAKRKQSHTSQYALAIWHENKAGQVSSHPYSCALRANASYNYLLVNGERRLTSREMLRLQGFPENFKIICNHFKTRKQVGNAVCVPLISKIISCIFTE